MEKIKNFILDAVREVKQKVSWPPYKMLQDNSILVLLVSIIFAIVIGVIDFSYKNIIDWFYSIF